jgi:hypothetical protein
VIPVCRAEKGLVLAASRIRLSLIRGSVIVADLPVMTWIGEFAAEEIVP